MENSAANSENCGCDSNCCKPDKKRVGWKLWISILILVAAIAIVAFKVGGNHPSDATGKEAASACDTTKGAACDTTKGSSCCP